MGLILRRLVVKGRTRWVHSRSREQAGLHCCSPRQAASSCPSSHPPSAFPRLPGATETHGDAQDKLWNGRSALPGGAHIRVTGRLLEVEEGQGRQSSRVSLVPFPLFLVPEKSDKRTILGEGKAVHKDPGIEAKVAKVRQGELVTSACAGSTRSPAGMASGASGRSGWSVD